jgi:hypothetical protein
MKQYKYLSNGQSFYIPDTSGIRTRFKHESGVLCNDVEKYVNGFLDAENTGWERLNTYTATTVGARFRIGTDGHFTIAVEITATGFSGIQDTDWEKLK